MTVIQQEVITERVAQGHKGTKGTESAGGHSSWLSLAKMKPRFLFVWCWFIASGACL